jgi:hypothetical protein
LQSPAILDKAKGLLVSMAANIGDGVANEDSADRQVLVNFLKLRQTIRESLAAVYADAAREMVKRSPSVALLYLELLLQEVCGPFVTATNQDWSAQANSSRGDAIKFLTALLPAAEHSASALRYPTFPAGLPSGDAWAASLKQHLGDLTAVASGSFSRLPGPNALTELVVRPKLVFAALLLGVAASRTFQKLLPESQEPNALSSGLHDLVSDERAIHCVLRSSANLRRLRSCGAASRSCQSEQVHRR